VKLESHQLFTDRGSVKDVTEARDRKSDIQAAIRENDKELARFKVGLLFRIMSTDCMFHQSQQLSYALCTVTIIARDPTSIVSLVNSRMNKPGKLAVTLVYNICIVMRI
jgi:hypothetical protein